MPGLKEFLLTQGPKLAMAFMAAKQGGPQAVSGLLQGLQSADMRRQQMGVRQQELDRQTRLDQRQTQLDQQAEEDRAFRRSDVDADNARAGAQFKQQQFEHALALMQRAAEMQTETASDPAEVEAALQQQAGAIGGQYGVPAEQLTKFAPPAAPIIAKGVKADIAALLEGAATESKRRNQPYDDTTISFAWSALKPRLQQALLAAGHPEGQDVKPSELDQLRGLVVSQAPPAPKPATPGSFEDYLNVPPKRQGEIEAARKKYMQADDRPVVVTPEKPDLWATDPTTGKVRRMSETEAAAIGATPPPSVEGGMGMAAIRLRNTRAASALNSIERLKELAPVRVPGPAGMVQGAVEVAKGYTGYSTKTRQYQAMLQPTAMQMAAAIQGAANLSDNERKAMAGMLGSISTMDYESQMALLTNAAELLQNGADVEKVGKVWKPRAPGTMPAQGAPPTVSSPAGGGDADPLGLFK